MTNTPRPGAVSGLSQLAPLYRHLLCDVWGVVHDGARALPDAGLALAQFREAQGRVLLITNAPRLKSQVVDYLDRLGVLRAAYDDIVTSGEATRDYLRTRPGEKVYHLGPDRDLPIYQEMPVERTGPDEATMIVCTGLFDDETETPDDYAVPLAGFARRGLPLVCANPDIVVERGARLVWCAGALAERYREIGGTTIVFGKPHPPVYATALARLAALAGAPVEAASVLAIGDGLSTDVRGANQAGLDVLFISGGIHADAFGDREQPDQAAIHKVLADAGLGARAYIPRLAW